MVLITGAAGHLGNTLTRELLHRGERVRALILPGEDVSSLEGLDVERMEGNTLDPQSLAAAFVGIDRVFHLAGIISILPGRDQFMREVNVLGTWNVLRAAREAGVRRLVYVSSIHALARPPKGVTIDESVPFDPHSAEGEYDRTKAEASILVQQEAKRGLDAVIVCPTGLMGPYDYRGSEMGKLIRCWLQPGLHALVDGTYDFADVRDVVQGLLLAMERGTKGETYILSGRSISLPEMLGIVREVSGARIRAITLPRWVARAAAPFATILSPLLGKSPRFTTYSLKTVASNCDISNAKARAELGYAPRDVRITVSDTVAWWRDHPEIQVASARPRKRRWFSPRNRPGSVAVVTGASSGIGAVTARMLAAAGYTVLLVARRTDRLDQLASEISAAGGKAEALTVDLSKPDGPKSVFDHIMERYGGLDVLVNNAGFGWYGWTSDMQLATAQDMIQLNNAALTQLIVLFLPVMRRAGRGHIINVSSIAGSIPSQGVVLYSATKSFVDALTTALYRELRGTGVHVSEVKPGPVLTEFYRTAERQPMGGPVPAERYGIKPETVAEAILKLIAKPRRTRYVPGRMRIIPLVELTFGWLIDRLGPLLLRKSYN